MTHWIQVSDRIRIKPMAEVFFACGLCGWSFTGVPTGLDYYLHDCPYKK